jgi:hypothetical protein
LGGRHGVAFSACATAGRADGFGSSASGEDKFDAVLGLLKMVKVAYCRRPERNEKHDTTATWEGWILGR